MGQSWDYQFPSGATYSWDHEPTQQEMNQVYAYDGQKPDYSQVWGKENPFAGAKASATGSGGLTPDQINRAVQGSGHKEIVDDRRPGEAPIGYKSGPIKMTPALRAKLRQNRGDQPESGSILGKYWKPPTGNEVQDTINQAQASGQAFGEFAAPVANILARLAPTYGLNPKAHEAAAQGVVGGLINTPFNFGADLQIATDTANKATPLQRLGAGANILAQTPVAEMVASPILKIAGKAIGKGIEAIKGAKPSAVIGPALKIAEPTVVDATAAINRQKFFGLAKEIGLPPHVEDAKQVYYDFASKSLGKKVTSLSNLSPDEWNVLASDMEAVRKHVGKDGLASAPMPTSDAVAGLQQMADRKTAVTVNGKPALVGQDDPFAALAEPKARTAADAMADFQRLVGEAKGSGSAGVMGGEKVSKYIEAGGYLLEAGVRTAKEWGEQMVHHFGEEIRPHLDDIWEKVNRPKSTTEFKQPPASEPDPFETANVKKGTPAERAADLALAYHRFNLLSGPGIVGKMATSAVQTAVTTPIEDIFGAAVGKLNPTLAAKSPWEGNPKGIVNAWKGFKDLFTKDANFESSSVKDALTMLKSGKNELEKKFGQSYGGQEMGNGGFLNFFGRLHGAAMTPLQRSAYIRALGNRMDGMASSLVAPTKEALDTAAKGAYQDSLQAIFRNDSKATQMFKDIMNVTESHIGKPAATLGKAVAAPIVSVPVNVAGRMAEYTQLGSAYQTIKMMARGGAKSLTPEEAAAVMRAYKRGGVGAGLTALGYFAPQVVDKLPGPVKHNPAVQAMVIGKMIRESKNAGDTANQIKNQVVQNVPLSGLAGSVADATGRDTNATGKAIGQQVAGWSPASGALGYIARTLDKKGGPSLTGDTNKRSSRGFRDEIKQGLPVIRAQGPLAGGRRGRTRH